MDKEFEEKSMAELTAEASVSSDMAPPNAAGMWQKLLVWVGRAALPALILAAWQLGVDTKKLDPFFFSSPAAIGEKLWTWLTNGTLIDNVAVTLEETFIGYLLGVVLGVAIGFLLFERPLAGKICEPYLAIFNAIPRVIMAPIFVLWLGLGISSKVVLVATVALLIVFFNTYAGLKEVDSDLIASMRVMGATKTQIRRFVLLPSVLVWIFGSLRATIGLAFSAAVVGEYVGATRGMGYLISLAQGTFDASGVFTGLVVITIVVFIVSAVIDALERSLSRWKVS